jgi:hypothetical protein
MEEGGVRKKREETRHVDDGILYGDLTLDSVTMEIHQNAVSRLIIPHDDKSAQYQQHLPRGGGLLIAMQILKRNGTCGRRSIGVRDGAMPGGKERSDESFSSGFGFR